MSDDTERIESGQAAGASVENSAQRVLSNLVGKMERKVLMKRMQKILAKIPDQRNEHDIDFLLQNTSALPILSGLNKGQQRDLCKVMKGVQTKERENLSQKGHITSFYYVLSGTLQEDDYNDVGLEDDAKNKWKRSSMVNLKRPAKVIFQDAVKKVVEADQPKMRSVVDAAILSETLASERREELSSFFASLDADGSGAIDKEEVSAGLKKLKVKISAADLDAVFALGDTDGSGEIDFEEFVTVMEDGLGVGAWWNSLLRNKELQLVFNKIDVDGSGAIDVDELRDALNWAGAKISSHELQDLFSGADDDDSGEIEFDEFQSICDTCTLGEPKLEFRGGHLSLILTTGCFSGELAVMTDLEGLGQPLTLLSREPSYLLEVDRKSFQDITRYGYEGLVAHNLDYLSRTKFASLPVKQLRMLATDVQLSTSYRGRYLFQPGDEATEMYIIHSGDLKLFVMTPEDVKEASQTRNEWQRRRSLNNLGHTDGAQIATNVRRQRALTIQPPRKRRVDLALLGANSVCGEDALLRNEPHPHGAEVTSARVTFFTISRDMLARTLGEATIREVFLPMQDAHNFPEHHQNLLRKQQKARRNMDQPLNAPPVENADSNKTPAQSQIGARATGLPAEEAATAAVSVNHSDSFIHHSSTTSVRHSLPAPGTRHRAIFHRPTHVKLPHQLFPNPIMPNQEALCPPSRSLLDPLRNAHSNSAKLVAPLAVQKPITPLAMVPQPAVTGGMRNNCAPRLLIPLPRTVITPVQPLKSARTSELEWLQGGAPGAQLLPMRNLGRYDKDFGVQTEPLMSIPLRSPLAEECLENVTEQKLLLCDGCLPQVIPGITNFLPTSARVRYSANRSTSGTIGNRRRQRLAGMM